MFDDCLVDGREIAEAFTRFVTHDMERYSDTTLNLEEDERSKLSTNTLFGLNC